IQMLLQVHDEILFQIGEEVPIDEAVNLIRSAMEVQIQGFVPIQADFSVGYSWGYMVDHTPGLTLDKVSYLDTLKISGESSLILRYGDKLNELFKEYDGDVDGFRKVAAKVLLEIDGMTIQPGIPTTLGEKPATVVASKN